MRAAGFRMNGASLAADPSGALWWLDRVSPLAVPVLLEIGKEFVYGGAIEELLAETAAESESDLVAEAMSGADMAELPL